MRKFAYLLWLPFLVGAVLGIGACQSATADDDESLNVDDFVDAVVTPNPVSAEPATDGKTYRVVRGNNQPDEILLFDWKTTFGLTVSINKNATDKDVDLNFPVEIVSTAVKVEQASGGIITPPTGGETEHYDSVLSGATGNKISAVGGSVSMNFEVWYDLPSLKKEAAITITLNLKDDGGKTFAKMIKVNVAP
ncbi:MAG TPA: hypothetical protein PLN93_08455 [Vicinamibacterales bacterium]|nr:hypothetical protein [Vicinamibacterales bacterium]HOQ60559.1 hypothetical protein [Vicinamibacterales bacterium]HPK71958.1 hypothetical protein [Vicinamibacterales bacterium]HPW19919.1 hypothetical protein [Vicinamibacterales bacterium]